MGKVTDPELLRALNAEGPTLKERDTEAGIGQSQASAENLGENAETNRQTRPYVVRKAKAEAEEAEKTTGVPKLTPGQQEIDKQFGDDYLQWAVRGGRGDFQKSKAQLEDALTNLGKSDAISGPVVGSLPEWLQAFVAPDAIKYPEEVQEIAQRNLRAILGGQFAQKEGEQLIARAFNPKLDEATNQVRVQRLLGALVKAAQSKEDAAKYYEEHGTLVGWKGSLPSKSDLDIDYDKAVEDELGLYDPNAAVTDEGDKNAAGGADGGAGGGGPGGGGPDGGAPPDDGGPGYDMSTILRGLGQGAGSMVEAAGSIPGIAIDPVMSLIYKYAGYKQPYNTGEVLREAVGLPDNPNATSDLLIKGGASGLSGAGAATGLSRLVNPGALKTALSLFGATPGRDAVAGITSAGASEVARRNDFGVPTQIAAGLFGGLGGYGSASLVNRAVTPHMQTAVGQAADRLKVGLLPADVGGSATRIMTNAALASPFSADMVAHAAERTQRQLGNAAGRVARQVGGGDVPTTDVAGEFLRGAAKRYNAKTRDIGNTMYKQAWKASGDVKLPAPNTIKVIDGFLKDLRANPETNASAISDLMKIRRDLGRGQTAEQMHNLRSETSGGVFDGKLRSNAEQGRAKAIRSAMTQDMLGFFDNNFKPGIANRIRKADKFHAERVEHIDSVLQPIIGKEGYKGGEQIIESVESMARGKFGGNLRLGRMMKEMTEPERQQVRSVIIDRIGRPAADAEFSPVTFFGNWRKMTPQAKDGMFPDGKMRQALDDLAKLSESTKTSKNVSGHTLHKGLLGGNIALQSLWATLHPISFMVGAGSQFAGGALLSSPKFARWLAHAPVLDTPAKQRKALDQIGVIASQDPIIRQDALAFRNHLEKSFEQSPGMAAAAEEEESD